jgi:hypothetical protein
MIDTFFIHINPFALTEELVQLILSKIAVIQEREKLVLNISSGLQGKTTFWQTILDSSKSDYPKLYTSRQVDNLIQRLFRR